MINSMKKVIQGYERERDRQTDTRWKATSPSSYGASMITIVPHYSNLHGLCHFGIPVGMCF